MQYQEIRADYNKETIVVYQAYNKHIAMPAIQHQSFQKPFSFHRMTWIKPSFLWLMERSNWGNKSNQECILGIRISRAYWEEALAIGVLTHPDEKIYRNGWEWEQAFNKAKVHIQWDPERTIKGAKLNVRTIQVGIGRELIGDYNERWITEIKDYTPLVKKINSLRKQGKYKAAKALLPKEKIYPVSEQLAASIGIG